MINGLGYYTGVVEDRDDPLRLGRCRVRVVGLHTENKTILPTEYLPWATPLHPITSAAMNGIGWTPIGPVLGTWVVIIFRDPEQQQPIILGTFGGIPQSKSAQQANDSNSEVIASNGGVLVDSSGNTVTTADGIPITVGTVEAGNNAPNAPSAAPEPASTEQKTPGKPSDDILKSPIPTDPPANSTSNPKQAKTNIQYLIDACDKVGLTSKYAKCAILGICGGETGWLPLGEYTFYQSSDLIKIFGRTFPLGSESEAEIYSKWDYKIKGREDFFRKIYNPKGNGYLVGNTQPDDGAKYYGRGFNQLTGRAGYLQIEKFLKSRGIAVDLMNTPDLLLTDSQIAALACAAFYVLNVKHDQNDPGYFVAARARTGADAGGGYAKKQKYYEYFLGASVSADSTNKPYADENKVYTKEEVKNLPVSKQNALLETRTENQFIGFCDPNGKYPLKNMMDEPDTNRLARGVIKETAIEFKDLVRTKQIRMANTEQTWEQPIAPYGGKYPYSKVYETESGHLQIFDDTPTHENISLYHKKGTFLDIDANGTQVNKIVGDGYCIIDRNGSIYIAGAAKVTVGNSVNILVQGMADIQVQGATTLNVNNNVDIGIAGNLNIAVGGDYNLKVVGDYNITADGSINSYSGTNMSSQASGNISNNAMGNVLSQAGGTQNIKAGGNVNVDGAEFHGQEGSSENATAVIPIELTPPDNVGSITDQYQVLPTPVRPSPPIELKYKINEENRLKSEDYINNPETYKNTEKRNNKFRFISSLSTKDMLLFFLFV
jgi:predicted chitinase